MASDLLSTLKSYLSKVADGEHTPAELANSLNSWIKESTESIKLKVEDEVQRSVAKMGFIKRAEFDELKRELRGVRSELASLQGASAASVSTKKKPASRKASLTTKNAATKITEVKKPKAAAGVKKVSPTKKPAKARAKGKS